MADERLNLAHRFWRAFNERELSGLGELLADDYVNHAALPGTSPGPAGQADVMKRLWQAFPDANFTIEYLAIDDERSTLICVGTMEGTHEGELMGIPASHNAVRWHQCHFMRLGADGRASEHHAIRDDLGLMRQMGVGPVP